MKRSFLLFLFILTLKGYGQAQLEFSEVVSDSTSNQEQLYTRARAWFKYNYTMPANAVMEDEASGRITGKGIINFVPKRLSGRDQVEGKIYYDIILEVKDGRYRYTFTNFRHVANGNAFGSFSLGELTTAEECPEPKPMAKRWSNKTWTDAKETTRAAINKLSESLKAMMQTKDDDDKW